MFLSLVHLREARCALCNELLATPGARSFIVDAGGNPYAFPQENPPEEMLVRLRCTSGHVTEMNVPAEVSAEESLQTPDDAPLGADAEFMP